MESLRNMASSLMTVDSRLGQVADFGESRSSGGG